MDRRAGILVIGHAPGVIIQVFHRINATAPRLLQQAIGKIHTLGTGGIRLDAVRSPQGFVVIRGGHLKANGTC